MMLGLGFLGFMMRKVGVPEAPLIITFLIAPMLEENLRRALLINRGDWNAGPCSTRRSRSRWPPSRRW